MRNGILEQCVSRAQIQMIHRLKGLYKWDEETYRHIISEFSGGRTETSKELTRYEATKLIERFLKNLEEGAAREIVGVIYALSFEIGFLNKGYGSSSPEEVEMNKAKINAFVQTHGVVKKPITQMTLQELELTMRQLQKIAKKEKEKR